MLATGRCHVTQSDGFTRQSRPSGVLLTACQPSLQLQPPKLGPRVNEAGGPAVAAELGGRADLFQLGNGGANP